MIRVKYSFAEYTPTSASPSIPMKEGNPAPEPTKTASKSISSINSSIESTLPITIFVIILTPKAESLSISFCTIDFGNLNSGIPYTNTPPAVWNASNIVTS